VIKVVVAYIDADVFVAIRKDLAAHGIVSISVAVSGGASTDAFVSPHFSGTPHTHNLAAKLRLEAVVGADLVATVKEIIFAHEGKRSFLFVMSVDEVHPEESVVIEALESGA
jgi:nitrogen regulatory protein PII